ncbi:Similar to S.cerevisiae protein MRF1 (Mitochondrial translation release factor) [Malassezia sympodialis ATCC 42132]|uniref:Similar to S.cerevisiae protein MRF1 (Mitochondrial translation release factor) n=1 Tax=Malassezia sympodialis (strain ATCC 42132) TaxID=1230383 RepID=A0A1M8A3R4_MALS4|nr:Similar to S.cerevisiae protein MRF1 (Mitochondrial translation release factor) [Malassezia sympodialis ATCC 42132]
MLAQREALLQNIGAPGFSQKIKDMEALNKAFLAWKDQVKTVQETQRLVETEKDADLLDMAQQELASMHDSERARYQDLQSQILSTSNSVKSKGAIIELKQGVGGQESCLFLSEMLRMYMKYCENRAQQALESGKDRVLGSGWRVELLSATPVDVSTSSGSSDALREAILQVHGEQAYEALRFEAGVHRVQRIPATQNLGKLQTSTIAIIVLPMQGGEEQADDILDPKDVRIETMRARGAGGQHVNRTESAVRLTHDPTGITVSMQDSRSQHQNRAKAWEVLRARLLDRHLKKEAEENKALRRSQVASADRSERVRTYNFPQDRVTDHRVGISLSNIGGFMDGDDDDGGGLTYLLEELMASEDEIRLHALLEQQGSP